MSRHLQAFDSKLRDTIETLFNKFWQRKTCNVQLRFVDIFFSRVVTFPKIILLIFRSCLKYFISL